MSEPLPISTLKNTIWGDGGFDVLDKSNPDKPDDNPFPEMILRNQVNAALKSSSGASCVIDLPLPPVDDVDSEQNSEFWKAPVIVRHEAAPDAFTKADRTPITLAKKLGITRTEKVVTESGDVWVHAFNSQNELVDARLLLPEIE